VGYTRNEFYLSWQGSSLHLNLCKIHFRLLQTVGVVAAAAAVAAGLGSDSTPPFVGTRLGLVAVVVVVGAVGLRQQTH